MTTHRIPSLGRRMGTAALIVSGGVLLSRILGQVRDVVFASMLGADGITDQYVAAFTIPDFLNYLLAGGFLSITFIPIFARYLADDDEEGGWAALTAIIRPIAVAITALVAIGVVLAPVIVDVLFPRFTPEQVDATVRLTRIVLPAQLFFVVGALFTAVQYTKGVFTIPTLAPIIYNLGIIAGGVGYAVVTGDPDPEGFVWGALIGAFVGNFALQWWGARRVGMRFSHGLSWRHPALREYLLIALPLMIGQSIVVLDETFMRIFGQYVGSGAQTELRYARQTMLVPVGVIAQAAAVAAYPFLARLFAEGRIDAMKATVDKALRYVVVLAMAATGLVAAMSTPIVRALFQRYEFTAADTAATAAALFCYAFAIPLWGMLQILNRAFYARREMWTPVVVGTTATLAAIPIYAILQNAYGLRGVAIASAVVLAIYTAILTTVWYGDADGIRRIRRVAAVAGKAVPLVVAGAVAAGLASRGVQRVVPGEFTASILAVLVGTAVFVVVAFGLGTLLHDSFTVRGGARDDGADPAGDDERVRPLPPLAGD
ncbi:MAG: murein biosynthesis integral membrane protein MurJ [Acidimicrobiia bacterium]